MAEQTANVVTANSATPTKGTAGLQTQVPNAQTTVSNAAAATGGISAGNFIETDIDQELFKFNSDDTPLMSLMLQAKKVNVNSPVVDHYMIDESRLTITTSTKVAAGGNELFLPSEDRRLVHAYDTLRVRKVAGYEKDGKTTTPGKDLMLFVTGRASSGNPTFITINGAKDATTDVESKVPASGIPAGTTIDILANALYETQKVVPPDLIVPQPTRLYLQKRGLNQVVSDYFDAQKKRIPFSKALIAEAAILNFKRKGNRTLWVGGGPGEIIVDTEKTGQQTVYTTEGVRSQFKKELQHSGKWTYEQLIALAKMFFTGEDVPNTAIALCGKNFLENIQCIDFSKHPEVNITVQTNKIGWSITNIHTVFGDIQLKREPTLDRLGYSNSAALLGEDRLVHYVYKNESSFSEDIEGEEAKRNGIIVWDGLGLKGTCHIWVDGEGDSVNGSATTYVMWDGTGAPATETGKASPVYYLLNDVTAINAGARAGELWQYDGTAWVEYSGELA